MFSKLSARRPGVVVGMMKRLMPFCLGASAIGPREEEAVGRLLDVAAPNLLAGDDVVVAVADGAGGQAGEVGPRVGLGEALVEVDLGAGDGAEEALLLLLRPVLHERDAEVAGAGVAGAHPVIGALLGEDDLAGERGVLSAVLLGPGHGEPALVGHHLLEALVGLEGALRLVVHAAEPVVGQLGGVEVADLLTEGLVFRGKYRFHLRFSCGGRAGASGAPDAACFPKGRRHSSSNARRVRNAPLPFVRA